jgi:hypothetical protein
VTPADRTLAVDLDGVLCRGEGAYESRIPDLEQIDRVRTLEARGWRVVIWSARSNTRDGRARTLAWIRRHSVPCSALVLGKPKFDALIDDRAIPELPPDLEAFELAARSTERLRTLAL